MSNVKFPPEESSESHWSVEHCSDWANCVYGGKCWFQSLLHSTSGTSFKLITLSKGAAAWRNHMSSPVQVISAAPGPCQQNRRSACGKLALTYFMQKRENFLTSQSMCTHADSDTDLLAASERLKNLKNRHIPAKLHRCNAWPQMTFALEEWHETFSLSKYMIQKQIYLTYRLQWDEMESLARHWLKVPLRTLHDAAVKLI